MSNGLLLINKPPNITSGDLTRRLERIFKEKAGHTGILDPKVSGLMLFLIGKARRLVKFFMGMDKEYEGIMYLHKEVEMKKLEETIKLFEGEITQLPPRRSKVARVPRKRKIYYIKLLKVENKDVYFKVKCEAGTYIRKLCHDIGEELGVGAHMKYLKRVKVGPFRLEDAVLLEELEKSNNPEKFLIPLNKIPEILEFSVAEIDEKTFRKAKNGMPLKKEYLNFLNKRKGIISIYYKENLVGIGRLKGDKLYWDCVLLSN